MFLALVAIKATTYESLHTYDYPGNNIISYKQISLDQCVSYCSMREFCVAAAWNYNTADCQLKNALGKGVYNPSILTKPKMNKSSGYYFRDSFASVDHVGDDLRYMDIPYGHCYRACEPSLMNTNCFAYVFDLPRGRGCWLKSKFDVNAPKTPNKNRQLNICGYVGA